MAKNVLIFGAGSIGNHLAFACRNKNWDVTIIDVDSKALDRTRDNIYPSRYSKWDSSIQLVDSVQQGSRFDIVVIGTPPDSHLDIATNVLNTLQPRIVLIEKPLTFPGDSRLSSLSTSVKSFDTTILVGYNHNLTRNTIRAEQILLKGIIGRPQSIHVLWLESWEGIFAAHPWLDGPQDSYLGYSQAGGGACSEHSHAISLWQHFSRALNCGKITKVNAIKDIYQSDKVTYDRTTVIGVMSKSQLTGSIVQDVVTLPPKKMMRIQGSDGFLEWHANYDADHDAVIYGSPSTDTVLELFPKSRPDDFVGEIDHIEQLLDTDLQDSPISLQYGIDVMNIITASDKACQNLENITIE